MHYTKLTVIYSGGEEHAGSFKDFFLKYHGN